MAEKVGGIYYEVSLDTDKALRGQREMDRQLAASQKSLDGFEARLNAVTRAVTAYAGALYLVRQSDAFTKLNAQLKLATDSASEFAVAQDQVRRIAQEAQTEITGVGTLYARISTATKELGTSQQQVADITRVVALALKVSGAGAQESASATLQLSQAFASGVLRGEEFNAVSEAAPRLMRALADGIGIPTGQLRAMAEQGLLTSSVLAGALPKALGDLEREAREVQTISGAFQQLRNEVLLFVGEQTSASGAAKLTADAISALAVNLDALAAAAYGYAATKLARLLLDVSINAAQATRSMVEQVTAHQAARAAAVAETQAKVQSIAATQAAIVVAREEMAAKLAAANAALAAANAQAAAARSAGAMSFALAMVREAEVSATVATKARSAALAELAILGQQQARITAAMTAAQAAQTAAITATGTAATIASRALGLLGGPIGAITLLLGLGTTAWALWGDAAEKSEAKASESVERSTEEITASLDKQIAKLKERNELANAGLASIAKQETEAATRLATLQGQINNLMAGKGLDGGAPLPEAARLDLLQKLLAQYGTLAGKVAEVAAQQDRLGAAGQSSKLTEWMAKYATDAERAANEIERAKKDLGGAFTPELEQRIRQKYMPAKPPKQPTEQREPRDFIGEAEADISRRLERWSEQNQRTLDRVDEETARRAAESMAKGREMAVQAILDADPVAKLEAELQAKSALLADYAAIDQENLALYAEARVALEEQTAQRIAEIQERRRIEEAAAQAAVLQNYSALFGSMGDIVKTFGGEQSRTYQALFAVSKAFAIAESIIKIQQGIANAAALPFPANLGAMATVAASTAGIVATIQGTQFGGGRQYGGPASAGTLYRVNEGGRPEMFTARNGAQYMLPTADGNVTPAGKVSGRGGITINQTVNVSSGVNRAEVAQAVAQGNRALVAELQAQGVI